MEAATPKKHMKSAISLYFFLRFNSDQSLTISN